MIAYNEILLEPELQPLEEKDVDFARILPFCTFYLQNLSWSDISNL